MIEHEIKGSLHHWTKFDEKSKTEAWRGYIIARLLYSDEGREKFPFLQYDSYRIDDDRWCRALYLNPSNVWQAKFILLTDETAANDLIKNLVKPEFKDFVELLAPLVPEDFKVIKKKKNEKRTKNTDPELLD